MPSMSSIGEIYCTAMIGTRPIVGWRGERSAKAKLRCIKDERRQTLLCWSTVPSPFSLEFLLSLTQNLTRLVYVIAIVEGYREPLKQKLLGKCKT